MAALTANHSLEIIEPRLRTLARPFIAEEKIEQYHRQDCRDWTLGALPTCSKAR